MSFCSKWPVILGSGICGVLLAAGCSSATQHKWLTVFFDGVPEPGRATGPARPTTPQAQTTNSPPVAALVPSEPPLVVHAPYADRNCEACHASSYSQKLKDDISRICTGCHKTFQVQAKFVHAPVADGQCTLCHTAHQGKEKFRLVKNSRELCFDCHEPDEVLKLPACGGSGNRACSECHNPHQENRRFLLRDHAGKPSLVQNETFEQ